MTMTLTSGDGKMEIEPYNWLTTGDTERKIEIMRSIADDIAGLPDTALTYRPLNFIDTKALNFLGFVMEYHGFWSMPDQIGPISQSRKFVNPEHSDAHQYPDVLVECECGAMVVHQDDRHVDRAALNDHSEDCKIEWQRWVEGDLWARRREILQRTAELDNSLTTVQKRLSVANRSVYSISRKLGIDYGEMRKRGVKRKYATWLWLSDHGYDYRTIGEAFALSKSTVGSAMNRLKDIDVNYSWRDNQ